ncbi:MAG: glycoside hydrolase family 2 TIM barrel-domain containing protein [Lachnospiraceae bacterium]|nr:glycoside hydrolase family 2 TIM barrel-domain containing protein [Lachnospiraceae bacterium]MDD3615434.1 glycoside hydrolase family 2 TIM barrel-domain containing protein [Lachnospiraceae bacterium]
MGEQLYTRWGKQIESQEVLKEYPRPQMVRESYECLNGFWDYAISVSKELPEKYDGIILVPFSPESVLSGVQRQLLPDEFLHYRKQIQVDETILKNRLLLHFGAVDQFCRVYVNGESVGIHRGGYTPFEFDITKKVRVGENVLQVVVQDVSETSYHTRGKQKLERGGLFYTAQSGIWQTVWMEYVPDIYVEALKMTPRYDEGALDLKVFTYKRVRAAVHATVYYQGEHVLTTDFMANETTRITIPDFCSWSPENPNLYDIHLEVGNDRIKSYFAMRKYSVEPDEKGILRYFLNNKPYFFHGVLDQGYWPDGLYTAPSDDALIFDIESMKELGFNTLRKHIKIESARWYYHCDRIGMAVWQDMMNGGAKYHWNFVCILPNFFSWAGRKVKDNKYHVFSRQDVDGRQEYYDELYDMVKHLYNYPSVALWTPFNEGWGQFDAAKATTMLRKLDRNRLIDEASGWYDQKGGDTYSIHNYWNRLRVRPKDRAIALTECGGYAWHVEDHSFNEDFFGYRKFQDKESLTARYCRLMQQEIIPNISRGLSAMIYTQLSDVEDEVNGFMTYDREILKMDKDKIIEINRQVLECFHQS